MAAGHSVDPDEWRRVLDGVLGSFAGRFGRIEPRRTAAAFVTGLLSDIESKTGWALAEQAGHARPDAMQRLLYRAVWDADAVRDDLRAVIVGRFADPAAVLVVDETGDLKKGVHSVGVQRQYTGTAGRIENAQVGVFLAYASRHGHTLADRRVYLPVSWTDDRDRCRGAGIPDDVGFATRSQLAADMIDAAVAARVPARWLIRRRTYGRERESDIGWMRLGNYFVITVRGWGYAYVGGGAGTDGLVGGGTCGRPAPKPPRPHAVKIFDTDVEPDADRSINAGSRPAVMLAFGGPPYNRDAIAPRVAPTVDA